MPICTWLLEYKARERRWLQQRNYGQSKVGIRQLKYLDKVGKGCRSLTGCKLADWLHAHLSHWTPLLTFHPHPAPALDVCIGHKSWSKESSNKDFTAGDSGLTLKLPLEEVKPRQNILKFHISFLSKTELVLLQTQYAHFLVCVSPHMHRNASDVFF